MQETLNSKKHGDSAFRAKDFATAIDCYTQVSTSLKYLLNFKTKPPKIQNIKVERETKKK